MSVLPAARTPGDVPTSLLSGLVNRGVGGLIASPVTASDLRAADAAADPAALPGWRRIGLLAGRRESGARPRSASAGLDEPAVGPALTDLRLGGLLNRAARYVLLAPIALRALAVVLAGGAVLVEHGVGPLWVLAVVAVLLVALDVVSLVCALRDPAYVSRSLGRWIAADLALALLANLLVSLTVSGDLHGDATSVTWIYLAGTGALVTTAWGGLAGAGVVVAGAGLGALMDTLNGELRPSGSHLAVTDSLAGAVVWLAICVMATLIGLVVLGLGIRLAMMTGLRAGRDAERTRMLRGMHDTVLQTLEAIALRSGDELHDPATALAEVRSQAGAQAHQLRRLLVQLEGRTTPRGLVDEITDVTAEMNALGLRTELVCSGLADCELDPASVAALRGAVRECLRNVLKHAGTTSALVRLDTDDDMLQVVVRDHGCGFDVAAMSSGFGLQQSVTARLAELGGRADVTSAPGRGTRVRLVVPLR